MGPLAFGCAAHRFLHVSSERGAYGETLHRGDELVLRAEMFKDEWSFGNTRRTHSDHRCAARVVWDQSESEWMRPLVDAITGIRVYDVYRLDILREPARDDSRRTYLHPSGGTSSSATSTTTPSSWRSSAMPSSAISIESSSVMPGSPASSPIVCEHAVRSISCGP